jgi:hypothetical protein
MKTTKLFACVKSDGMFLVISHSQSHIGYRTHVSFTIDIDEATLFSGPFIIDRKDREEVDQYVTHFVPVTRKCEVILEGYGFD